MRATSGLGCAGQLTWARLRTVSLTTCDLGLVLELTGGFGATSLAFIFRELAMDDAGIFRQEANTTDSRCVQYQAQC